MSKQQKLQHQILAKLGSYIIVTRDIQRDSRESETLTKLFVRISQGLLPAGFMPLYNVAQQNGFDVKEPLVFLNSIARSGRADRVDRYLSAYWMSEANCAKKNFQNMGEISIGAQFVTPPFSKEDLDYAALVSGEVFNGYDFNKLLERAKRLWRTSLYFKLGRKLNNSALCSEELSLTYDFRSSGILKGAEASAGFHEDFPDKLGIQPARASEREPKAWKIPNSESSSYDSIIPQYFPQYTGRARNQEELRSVKLEQMISRILPDLIKEGEGFVTR
jgi:hypothetical protein